RRCVLRRRDRRRRDERGQRVDQHACVRRRRCVPSARTTSIPQRPRSTNARRPVSFDHDGASFVRSAPPTTRSPRPSAYTIPRLSFVVVAAAMRRPSGDHVGTALSFFVTRRSLLPAVSRTRSPGWPSYATRCPFRDQAGQLPLTQV